MTPRRPARLDTVPAYAHPYGMATEMMSTAQVAKMLDINPRSVPDLVKLGVLPQAQKMPGIRGARLFDAADVRALAAEAGTSTVDEPTPATHGEPLLGVVWSPGDSPVLPDTVSVPADAWSSDPDRTTRRGEL